MWQCAINTKPPASKPVLVCAKRENGSSVVLRAAWIPAFTEALDALDAVEIEYESWLEYNEADETYYYSQGWYEQIECTDLYGSVRMHLPVLYWREIPKAP